MAQAKITNANLDLFKSILSFSQEHGAKVEEIKDSLEAYADERSDKWRDSDKGSEHAEFISKVEAVVEALTALSSALEDLPDIND